MIQPLTQKSLNIAMKIFQCYCGIAHLECVKGFYKPNRNIFRKIISANKQHNMGRLKLKREK